MNRQDYIRKLSESLQGLPQSEIQDIIRDQEELIADALQSGRSETDVLTALGSPVELARTLRVELKLDQATESKKMSKKLKAVFGALGALLMLAPFNLLVLLGPFLIILGVVLSGWVLATALGLASVALMGFFISSVGGFGAGIWVNLSLFFGIFSAMGVSVLLILGMYFITQWVIRGILSYFRWNLNFIKSRA